MKKLLGMVLSLPLALASCNTSNSNNNTLSKEQERYKALQGESDRFTKTISTEEQTVIDNVRKSSFIIGVGDHYTLNDFKESISNNTGYATYAEGQGTGWVIAETNTHYYIATNHHVIENYISDAATNTALSIYLSSWNQADDSKSDRVTIDKSVGTNGIIYNGVSVNPNDANDVANRWIDLAIFAAKKSDFTNTYNIIERKPTTGDRAESNSNETGYTAGFPGSYDIGNKGEFGRWGKKTGNKTEDAKPENGSYIEQDDGTTWYYENFLYKMYQGGGASGSAIVNKDGQLIALLAFGMSEELTGGPSVWEVNNSMKTLCDADTSTPKEIIKGCL